MPQSPMDVAFGSLNGGAGALLSPLSVFMAVKGLGDYIVAGNEADRAKREAEYRQAITEMSNNGFDFSVYSPEYLQSSMDAAGWADPNLDLGVLSSQMLGDVVSRYLANPASIITTPPITAPPTQSEQAPGGSPEAYQEVPADPN